MLGHDSRHTGVTKNVGTSTLTIKWTFATTGGVLIEESAPVIGPDGMVYVVSTNGNVYSIYPDGTPNWSYYIGPGTPNNPAISGTPAVGRDGTIYVPSTSGLYAFTHDGILKWGPVGSHVDSSVVIDSSGTTDLIYVTCGVASGGYGSGLCSFNPDGSQNWGPVGGPGLWYSTPAVGPSGTIYAVGSESGDRNYIWRYLYAISPVAGKVNWSFRSGQEMFTNPAVDASGVVYVGDNIGDLFAITDLGNNYNLDWTFTSSTGWPIGSSLSPTVDDLNGKIYAAGCCDGNLYSVNQLDGSLNWLTYVFPTPTIYNIYSFPAIDSGGDPSGGKIYFAGTDGYLYAYYLSNGVQAWALNIGGSLPYSPAIGPDGTIYIGCGTPVGGLCAIGPVQNSICGSLTSGTFPITGLSVPDHVASDGTGNLYYTVYSTDLDVTYLCVAPAGPLTPQVVWSTLGASIYDIHFDGTGDAYFLVGPGAETAPGTYQSYVYECALVGPETYCNQSGSAPPVQLAADLSTVDSSGLLYSGKYFAGLATDSAGNLWVSEGTFNMIATTKTDIVVSKFSGPTLGTVPDAVSWTFNLDVYNGNAFLIAGGIGDYADTLYEVTSSGYVSLDTLLPFPNIFLGSATDSSGNLYYGYRTYSFLNTAITVNVCAASDLYTASPSCTKTLVTTYAFNGPIQQTYFEDSSVFRVTPTTGKAIFQLYDSSTGLTTLYQTAGPSTLQTDAGPNLGDKFSFSEYSDALYYASLTAGTIDMYSPCDACSVTSSGWISGGGVSFDQVSTVGTSIAVVGSSAPDGTLVTVASDGPSMTLPPGTVAVGFENPQYYDVKIGGITDGSAYLCVTSSHVSSTTRMDYWDSGWNALPSQWLYNGSWHPSPGPSVGVPAVPPPDTVCGEVDVQYMTGTPIAVGIPLVVEPITATFDSTYGGSSQTVTVSGCLATPSTFPGDGVSRDVAMAHSCAFTLSLPSGYQFTGGTGTTTCSSGTCAGYTTSYEATPVTVTCSPGTAVVGTRTVCTAGVRGALSSVPTGKITWTSNSTGMFSPPSCRLSKGSCTVKYTPQSASSPVYLTANYAGDRHNVASSGSFLLGLSRAASTTKVSCSRRFMVVGASARVRCTATVKGYEPTGSVAWSQSGNGTVGFISAVDTCSLTKGHCSVAVTGTAGGTVSLLATYGGDGNNRVSTKNVTLTVKPVRTTLSVSCASHSVAVGAPATCVATLKGYYGSVAGENVTWSQTAGTGAVSFTPATTCNLSSGGTCSVVVTGTSKGDVGVTAAYAGDANNHSCLHRTTLHVTHA